MKKTEKNAYIYCRLMSGGEIQDNLFRKELWLALQCCSTECEVDKREISICKSKAMVLFGKRVRWFLQVELEIFLEVKEL